MTQKRKSREDASQQRTPTQSRRSTKKPPDIKGSIWKGRSRVGTLFLVLAVLTLLPRQALGTVTTCPEGYYFVSPKCVICTAGYSCAGGAATRVACTTSATPPGANYSLQGQKSCTQCPAGHSCLTTSAKPVACAQGTYATAGSQACSTCTGSGTTADTTQACAACSATQFLLSSKISCIPCEAGKRCSTTAGVSTATVCAALTVAKFGAGTCTASATMTFQSQLYWRDTCPANTFTPTSSNTASACVHCPEGKTCDLSTAAQNSCVAPTQSSLGANSCAVLDPGYKSTGATRLDRTACTATQIYDTGSSGCIECPAMKSCNINTQTSTACPTGFYSVAGDMVCRRIPYGFQANASTGALTACTTAQYFDPATGTCKALNTCLDTTARICNTVTGEKTGCQVTQYIDTSTQPYSCNSCLAGRYCDTGTQSASSSAAGGTATTAQQMSRAGTNKPIDCAPGYKCSSVNADAVACATGEFSLRLTNTCTDKPWVPQSDMTGANCPTETKRNTATRLYCEQSPLDSSFTPGTATDTTSACVQASSSTSWYGSACESCPGSSLFNTSCRGNNFFYDLKCPPGQTIKAGACDDIDEKQKEYVEGVERVCKTGHFTFDPQTKHAEKQCLDCPDLTVCYTSTSPGSTMCWGQNQPMSNFDQVKYLHLYDRRLPVWQRQGCQDCNAYDRRLGICTFKADYFTDHIGSDLTCPFQTQSRQLKRYEFPETHSSTKEWYKANKLTPARKYDNTSEENGYRGNNISPAVLEYTSFVWFLDDEQYEYPYCKTDHSYFDYQQLDDHNSTYATDDSDCTLYEYRTVNYKRCEPNWGGFISPSAEDTPTEVRVGNDRKYYSQLEYDENGEYTGNTLMECPQHTSILKDATSTLYTGGNSAEQACFLRRPGECIDTTSEYCNSGGDFMCPSGFQLTSATKANTFNDCLSCPIGSYCNNGVVTTCPLGYQCPAYSYEKKSYPAQPGAYIDATQTVKQCSGGTYCPGATGTKTNCPTGFNTVGSGTSEHENFSSLACKPDDAGTSCAAGKYCPEAGASTPIKCHPGTFSSSTTNQNQDDCADCTAGKWCPEGSSTASSQCPDGSYCPARTIFNDEFGCPAGKTSTGSLNPSTESSGCTDCPAGSWCREGIKETNLCNDVGYVCPSGSATREYCAAGTYIANPSGAAPATSANCNSCVAGSQCSGYGGMKSCRPGYLSSAKTENCTPTTAGSYTDLSGKSTQTPAANGYWALKGDITSRECPPGKICTGGVMTTCSAGKYCPEKSSTETAPPGTTGSGMVMNVSGLWYLKPCPSGSFCPTGVTTAPQKVGDGYWTEQGAITGTSNKCNEGYTCLSTTGSIGPWEEGCPLGSWTGADVTAGCNVSNCVAGTYCGQGRKYPCPKGFYCENGVTEAKECPVGTYNSAFSGTSVTSCASCDAGYACSVKSLTTTVAQCGAGYFCTSKATSTTPSTLCKNYNPTTKTCSIISPNPATSSCPNGGVYNAATTYCDNVPSDQGICPIGFYCTQGTLAPTSCASGQFSTSYGARDDKLCIDCTLGFYCSSFAARELCVAGYYCPKKTSDYTINKAPKGYFTQTGFPAAVKCLQGTYQATEGQAICDPCPLGSYCDVTGLQAAKACLAGHDCNQVGTKYPRQCKYGEYADSTQNGKCVACGADQYCYGNALSAGIDCENGYNCVTNTTHQYPNWLKSEESRYYLCTEGNYCDNSLTPTLNACPEGTFMPRVGAKVLSDCVPCPEGFYCPAAATVVPTKCDVGYYCPAGSGSPTGTSAIKPLQCTGGTYCPLWSRTTAIGTAASYPNIQGTESALKCPFGQYSTGNGQTVCTNCPAGTKCPALSTATPASCDEGYYCLLGDARSRLCDEGKITTGIKAEKQDVALEDCQTKLVTDWIKTVALKGTIADGYESLAAGETWFVPRIGGRLCQIGFYCVGGVAFECSPGKYCPINQMTADGQSCDAGYYCLGKSKNRRPTSLTDHFGDRCEAGKWCASGVSAGTLCAIGTYSSARGLTMDTECITCPQGYQCLSTGMLLTGVKAASCPAGFFCNQGIDGVTTKETECGFGKYCPGTPAAFTMQETPCAGGTYQAEKRKNSCKSCEAGYYCPFLYDVSAVGDTQKTSCPAGHECVSGKLDAATPCLAGYFKATVTTDGSACSKCTKGFYCPFEGTVTVLACPDLHYCPEGSKDPIPCINGQICRSSLPATQTEYTKCPKGKFCLKGKESTCYAGYICYEGSSTPTPTDAIAGRLCPQGEWCAAGVEQGTKCAIKTYNPYFGLTKATECTTCGAGEYCESEGLTFPKNDPCPAGYWCDSDGTQTKTDPGFYSPAGFSAQLKCPHGTYQPNKETSSCIACTAGNYCQQNDVSGATSETPCPKGFFCPAETAYYGRYPCAIGTYGETAGLKKSDECTACPEKYYCPKKGMFDTDYTKYICKDGYLCDQGSQTEEGSRPCPQDNYCKAGVQIACPAGTYSLNFGLVDESECIECPPGSYCPNNSIGIKDCPEGFYCPLAGKLTSDPSLSNQNPCPKGHYCPLGSVVELKCQPGFYQDETKSKECKLCPEGMYCPDSGMEKGIDCIKNDYCPKGSISRKKCPIGTYAEDDTKSCSLCPDGKYCWPCPKGQYCLDSSKSAEGHNGQENDCNYQKGFVCRRGAHSPEPTQNGYELILPDTVVFSTYSGPVIRGYTSDSAGVLTACPVGTFQPSFYATECRSCMKGRYCPNTGMSDIARFICTAGYWCGKGNSVATPNQVTNPKYPTDPKEKEFLGNVCSKGKQCNGEIIHEQVCPDGFYSNKDGLSICTTCPVGSFCDQAIQETPIACIKGSACDLGIKREPLCPSGTSKYTKGLVQECKVCEETYYCRAGKQIDKCVAGYICQKGLNTVPNPSIGQCPEGFYCPKGVLNPVRCPFETMSVQTAQRQISDCRGCQPGYVCEWGSYDYYPCPKGHWCPVMGRKIIYKTYINKCPPGTYSSWDKRVFQNECRECPEGYSCQDYAITNLTNRECPPGHYCPQGTAQPKKCQPGTYFSGTGAVGQIDCSACPAGKYCPEGSAKPISCSPGQYCQENAEAQITCPGGFYCNEDVNFQMTPCKVNSYCPRGSSQPIPCNIKDKLICGYNVEVPFYCGPGFEVIDNSKYQGQNECNSCPPGTFSTYTSSKCEPCPAGYACYGETNTAKPTLFKNHKGERCPKGHYCPTSTFKPIACPPGTYNPEEGKKSLNECRLCEPGTFQDTYGQVGCKVCGVFADSREGMDICECIGKNRAYSADDSTCRCKSGFDFLDSSEQSKGNVSDREDCFPLVFDNCKFNGNKPARQPDGTCVARDECSEACSGEPGIRSEILGVCSCSNAITVDNICNQACRKSAPKVTFVSSIQIQLQTKDGGITKLNLTDAGDVFGNIQDCYTESKQCEIKSVQMSSSGFEGLYGVPSLLEKVIDKNRKLGHEVSPLLIEHFETRRLQATVDGDKNNKIFNPIYCIKEMDSFLFSIEDPNHFPVYMKNSVMNTNAIFDYGAFQILEEEMLRRRAANRMDPSIFTFTFTKKGSYVFNDAANDQKILVVRVVGAGEECEDTDRFVQTITENSLAAAGVQQKGDLILQPNYPLIIAMGCLLIFATLIIMLSIGFCLHKGWNVSELNERTYRDQQLPLNIHHDSEELFHTQNDFINHKSELIDSEEDDLDNFNLDIQFDLIDAGERYLKTYNKRKQQHKNQKIRKRDDIKRLLKEIEDLIQQIGNNAMASNMSWLDLNHNGEIDEEVLRKQIENELQILGAREKEEDDSYQKKKEEMMKDASDRDKLIFKNALNKVNLGQNSFNKEMLSAEVLESRAILVSPEQAIYDNGDPNSRNNKYVAKIQADSTLTSEEKERLLKNHEQNLMQLSGLMDADKKRQEQELDRILKERLERRRRLKEKQYAQEIKEETKESEERINSEFDRKVNDLEKRVKDEQQAKINEILKNPDYSKQREQIRNLEREQDQLKKDALAELEREKQEKIEAAKQAIRNKFTIGPKDEAEMKAELMALMQDGYNNYDDMLQSAEQERRKQDESLQQRLRRRKQLNEEKRQAKQAEIESEFVNMDIEHIIEQEKAAEAALEVIEKEKAQMAETKSQQAGVPGFGGDFINKTLNAAIGTVNTMLDKAITNYQETYKVEDEKRKTESKKQLNKITDDIDFAMEKAKLMNSLHEIDSSLAMALEEDQKKQDEKQAAKRALLLARRRNKKKHELEEEKVKDQIQMLEEEDQEKGKITEEYIRSLFQKKIGSEADTPEQKEQKLQLLNEYLSDQFLERMAGLLMKQFTEKEQMLRIILQKYSEQQHDETNAIKQNFKIDKNKLEELKEAMPEQTYEDTLKQLRLAEANLLREVELKLNNAHKTEEASLRKELEKKHAAEQVDFRTKMATQQGKMRTQLLGDKALADGEALADKQSLDKYERSKKQEQERRLRNIELQKKTLQQQFENELSNKFSDFDDMLRRKKEQQKELDDNAANLRARIQERQEKIKQTNKDEGLTQEQQEALLKNLSKQLESLDSAYSVEQQRQQFLMKQKLMLRKEKAEKARKLKEQLERQEASNAAKDMQKKLGSLFKRQGTILLQEANDNSELMRRLRAWKIAKKKADDKAYEAKLANFEVDLDENETKIMILKLLQTEKMLKEIRRQVKKLNRGGLKSGRTLKGTDAASSRGGSRMGRQETSNSAAPRADSSRRASLKATMLGSLSRSKFQRK